jgi:hypothetical protein
MTPGEEIRETARDWTLAASLVLEHDEPLEEIFPTIRESPNYFVSLA